MTTTQSHIAVGAGGVSFVGPEAVSLYVLKVLRTGIRLHQKTGMIPNRGYTISKMLAAVSRTTGKVYRGKAKHAAALADLEALITAAEASIPVVRQ